MFRSLGSTADRTALAVALVLLALPASARFDPFSATKGAVEAAVEDRSAGDIAKDTSIKAKIAAGAIDKMGSDVLSLNADVYEQDVMLAGTVKTAEEKATAEKLTRGIEGVKTIYNEIRVAKPAEEKKGAVEGSIDDATIETKINALLIDARGVNVTNFRWRSVEGHVYPFGRALSKEELDKAVAAAKGIEGVASAASRVKIEPKT